MNFKSVGSLGLILLMALVSFSAHADGSAKQYAEGVNYTTFASPIMVGTQPEKVEVVEMFWAGCPSLLSLRATYPNVEKTLPADVEFIKMPSTLNPSWKLHARAFYAAETLLAGDKFHLAMFNAIHEQGRRLSREDAVVRFAQSQGLDGKKFREAMNSKATAAKVKKLGKLGKDYGLTGVPALMVAGKYKVNSSSVSSYEELFDLVDFLIEKERSSR